jgi:hypothetical protein
MPTAYKLTNEMKYRLAAGRAGRIYENHPDKGLSFGPHKVLFNLDNVHATDQYVVRVSSSRPVTRAWLFSFGAYGCTHVVAFGSLEDALEDAAATLLEVAPGSFVEPNYQDAISDMIDAGELEGVEHGTDINDLDDDEICAVQESAKADLTYTESGWLASWEWTCREVTPEEIVAFVKKED